MTTILQTISFIFVVMFPLFEVLCYAHLYWKRNDILHRKRNQFAVYVASLAGWLAYFNLVVSIAGGVPCGVFYVASLLIAPISVGPQIIRALALRGSIKYSQLVTEEEISCRASRKKAGGLPTIPSERSELGGGDHASPELMTKMMEANLVMERTKKVVKLTKWALLVVPALFVIAAWALTSDEGQLLSTDFDECQPEPIIFQYASPVFGIATAGLAKMVAIIVKKIDDEIGLRREIQRNAVLLGFTYIIIIFVRFMGYFEWQPLLQTMQQIMLSFSMTISPFLPRSSSVATWAKNKINPATKSAVPGYAQSLPKGRTSALVSSQGSTRASIQNLLGRQTSMNSTDQRNREVTVSWDAGLCILLSTEDGINAFSQHCAREFSSENVRFWCAVNDYKARFDEEKCIIPPSTEDDDENNDTAGHQTNEENVDMNAVAKELYSNFIDPSSKTQVNLSSKQRSEIKIAIDSGQVKREMFDTAQKEIFAVMSRDSYPRFLASKKNRRII